MGTLFPSFGPDTSVGVLPQPHLLLYYGLFFAFGALYFECDDAPGRLGRWWWLMTFGMIGLFRRMLTREYAVVRYLSDSSYCR